MAGTLVDLSRKVRPQDFNLFLESIEDKVDLEKIPKVKCSLCGNSEIMFLPFNSRKDALCSNCYSLERHRFLHYILFEKFNLFSEDTKLLHFAPEKIFYSLFIDDPYVEYYPVDINANYPLAIRRVVDMCSISFEDNYFDMILAVDVLEHIPDDINAMHELYRVVKPVKDGGMVILMVPLFRNLKVTFENEEYDTPELRKKYFGQEDHVRKYSMDIVDRLESVGFEVEEYRSIDLFSMEDIKKYGFKDVSLFKCVKVENF